MKLMQVLNEQDRDHSQAIKDVVAHISSIVEEQGYDDKDEFKHLFDEELKDFFKDVKEYVKQGRK